MSTPPNSPPRPPSEPPSGKGPIDPKRRDVHEGTRHGAGARRRVIVVSVAAVTALTLGTVGVVVANRGEDAGPSVATPSAGPVAPTPTLPSPTETAPGTSPSAKPLGRLESVAWWDRRFARYWSAERPDGIGLSRSADSWDHYNLSYSVDELTAAYQATGKRSYLDDALRLVENVMASSRPSSSLPNSQYKDSFRGWSSARDESGQEVPLYESYFWRYATSLLRVIHQSPQLADDRAVQRRYRAVLAFAERSIAQKWLQRGATDTIYRSRTHMVAHWALIATNLSVVTTEPSRRAQYRRIITSIDTNLPNYSSSLRQQLRPNPKDGGAYFWSDVWGSSSRPGQDVGHGSGVITYVVAARDQGIDWSQQDLDRFVQLLENVVWPRPGLVTEFVDGSGQSNGWLADGWVKLGRYDPELQRRLETHTVQNGQFLANGALNAALLRCPRTPASQAPPACDPAVRPASSTP